MVQRYQVAAALILEFVLVLLVTAAVAFRWVPAGVPGQWVWGRPMAGATLPWDGITIACLGVGAYAAFVALVFHSLSGKRSRIFEAASVLGLLFAAVCIQVIVPMGAPAGYDLAKWATVNYLSESTGYFEIARHRASPDPWKFLADYPDWIRTQDVFHIGTHPPGLIAAYCVVLRVTHANPGLTAALLEHMPPSVDAGFRIFTSVDPKPLSRPERATLYATALLTLLACAGTVVPLYLLARAALPAATAWAAAALWPLVPCANLFQPVADTAYSLLSTTALALAVWAVRSPQPPRGHVVIRSLLAVASGMVMAFGMSFTLAFLPVGLIVAVTLGASISAGWRTRLLLVLAISAGFFAVVGLGWALTSANPFVIARWNLRHHAEFYDEYPRTYAIWLWVNVVEIIVALGIPAAVWCLAGLKAFRQVPVSVWSTLLVLVLLDVAGRNLGEVARLWMLFMPPLLIAAGVGISRLGARPGVLGVTAALMGAQTLALQSLIQVVYPV